MIVRHYRKPSRHIQGPHYTTLHHFRISKPSMDCVIDIYECEDELCSERHIEVMAPFTDTEEDEMSAIEKALGGP